MLQYNMCSKNNSNSSSVCERILNCFDLTASSCNEKLIHYNGLHCSLAEWEGTVAFVF